MVSSVKQCDRPRTHRYKGVESLLRRIAFNLGNTPSQTEVKIISCIPIDVTDLQQKIICLEKQLALARGRGNRSQTPITINRLELRTAYPPDSSLSKNDQPDSSTLNADVLPPPDTDSKNENIALVVPQELPSQINAEDPVKSPVSNSTQAEVRRKKYKIPEKDRTRLVYYAQMAGTTNPFTNYKKINTRKKQYRDGIIDRKYLSSVIERQYRSMDMCEGLSQMSEPVCRDITPVSTSEEMCSCCQGNYLDLDRKKKTQSVFAPVVDGGIISHNSHFYDLKPVNEKPDKINVTTKKEEPDPTSTFCPEYYPFKPEYSLQTDACLLPHSHNNKLVKSTKTPHTEKVFIQNDSSQTEGLVEFSQVYTKLLPPKYRNKCNKHKPKSMYANCTVHASHSENKTVHMESKLIQTFSSAKLISTSAHRNKTENNQCSLKTISNTEIPIRVTKSLQTLSLSKFKNEHKSLCRVTSKNAECLALAMNETECQTEPLNGAQTVLTNPPESDGTEPSLNQIKSILETVLTEVKVYAQTRTNVEVKEPKEVISQKESVPIPDCERLLGSFNYNPYAANTPREYMTSCLPPYCSSMMPQAFSVPPNLHQLEAPIDFSYMRNYPIFVHRTLANQACGYDRSDVMKSKQTSTNTMQEPQKKRTTETEKLIKEIYKSIALNVDSPKQATSRPTIEDKAILKTSNTEFKTANTMTQGREEIILRGNMGPSRMTIIQNHSRPTSLAQIERHGGSFHQRPRIVTSAMRRQCNLDTSQAKPKVKEESGDTSDSNNVYIQPSAAPAKGYPTGAKKNFLKKVVSSIINKIRKRDRSAENAHINAIAQDPDWCEYEADVTQRTRPVKHVSYAPAQPRAWKDIAGAGEFGQRAFVSRSRHSSRANRNTGLEQDPRETRPHHSQRTPRYMTPSGQREYSGNSQLRREALLSNQHRSRVTSEYPRRTQHPYNTRPAPYVVSGPNDYRPRLQTKPVGLKISNKTWMRKPVYHFGFACGPEKRKIVAQN